jgi:hypothetical protein
MGLTLLLSMGTYFGFRRAAWVGVVLLILFLGGLVMSFSTFRREDDDKLAKELERARRGVRDDLRRRLTDVMRSREQLVQRHLTEVSKALLRRLDQRYRDESASLRTGQLAQQQDLTEKRRRLDQQLQEFDQLRTGLQRSQQGGRDFLNALRDRLRRELDPSRFPTAEPSRPATTRRTGP